VLVVLGQLSWQVVSGGWCWSFLGVVCEQSWAVEVIVGSGHRWGLWWLLWTVVVVGVGRFWARFVSGQGRWRSLWVVAIVVGCGGCCGPWWLLWAMAAVQFGVIVVIGRCCRLCSIGWFVDMGGGAVCLLVGAV